MSIFDRIFRRSSQPESSPASGLKSIPPVRVELPQPREQEPVKGIRDQGKCDPECGCGTRVPVIAAPQMLELVRALPELKKQGVAIAVFNGGGHKITPSGLAFAVAFLSVPGEQTIGLAHWPRGRHIFFRLEVLESLTTTTINDYCYRNVVRVLEQNGHNARDITFSATPCEPFGNMEPSISQKTAVIPCVSDDGMKLRKKGDSLSDAGQVRQALGQYDKAIDLNPGDATAWTCKAAALYQLKQFNESLCCSDCATEVDPTLGEAWFNKGLVLAGGLSLPREALACFEEARRLGIQQAEQPIQICRRQLSKNS